jgi:muconolactone delta-isomerase
MGIVFYDFERQHDFEKGERQMQYLVQMKLVPQGRPTTTQEGTAFIEQYIFPTLELCKKLQDKKKILAGGPMSGAIGFVLIVNAESALELDDLITNLPVWSRMETDVTPLTTFEGRAETLRPRLEQLKEQSRGAA